MFNKQKRGGKRGDRSWRSTGQGAGPRHGVPEGFSEAVIKLRLRIGVGVGGMRVELLKSGAHGD